MLSLSLSRPLIFRFIDADGPTLVGDPDLGFTGLRQFGPTLIHHSQLKYRESPLNFMLVSTSFRNTSTMSLNSLPANFDFCFMQKLYVWYKVDSP